VFLGVYGRNDQLKSLIDEGSAPTNIFVLLDREEINYNNIEDVTRSLRTPDLDGDLRKIFSVYSRMNNLEARVDQKRGSAYTAETVTKKMSVNKRIIYNPSPEEYGVCMEILKSFETLTVNKLIRFLPVMPPLNYGRGVSLFKTFLKG
jgi:hypothetical protein